MPPPAKRPRPAAAGTAVAGPPAFLFAKRDLDAFLAACTSAAACDDLAEAAQRRAAELRAVTKAAADAALATLAVDETVILLHPPLPSVGVSIVTEEDSVSKMTVSSKRLGHYQSSGRLIRGH